MENKKYDEELDQLIRASMKLSDTPSAQLNERLKADLFKQEAVMKQEASTQVFSLWYLPMIFNFVIFSLFAVLSLTAISNPYIAKFAACLCVYAAIAGIAITVVGITRTRMKENLIIHIGKRGAII